MSLLNYLYYKYFVFFNSINKEMSNFLAMMAIAWVMFFNVYSLLALIVVQLEFDLIKAYSNPYVGLLIVLTILLFNYMNFLYEKRYEKIIATYKKENKNKSLVGTLIVILYTGLSFWVCLFYVVPLITSQIT